MKQDSRYQAIGNLLTQGIITRISDMLIYVSMTKIRKDLGITHRGWLARMENMGLWTLEEMNKLSKLVGCDYTLIVRIINDEYEQTNSKK